MADNQNAKNAIEEYLNALLLDECEEQEASAFVSPQEEQSEQKIDSNLAEEPQITQAKVIGEAGLSSEAQPEQIKASQSQKEFSSTEKATGALEVKNSSKAEQSTDFDKSSHSYIPSTDEYEENFTKELEKGDFITGSQVHQTQVKTETEQKPSFVPQEEKQSWIGQTILMPKLRLATGEEVVVKTGTDKASKLNPSDFNTPPPPANWDNGRPEWGQNRFDCLLFKVMGLTLAVPLVELGGILRIEEAPKALFGQPNWFLGLMHANDENVYLVDTAKWVLPQSLIEKQDGEAYEFVIKIHNSSWGLCCNKVAEAISLNPDQVKWRSAGSKRPWLAGTVIKEMCALIDVSAFAQLLQSGHGNMPPVNVASETNRG